MEISMNQNEFCIIKEESHQGVWVFAEHCNNKVKNITYELMGEGRRLANLLGVELSVVLVGFNRRMEIQNIFSHGCDAVYLIKGHELNQYRTDSYTYVMDSLVKEYKPEIVLFGATSIGRDLAPRLAARLKTGLTADCTNLDIDMETRLLLQTRPTIGGNLMSTSICPDNRPQIATIRPGVMKKPIPSALKMGQIIEKEFDLNQIDIRTTITDVIRDIKKKIDLDEAEIIISGGRGLGNAEGFRLIESVAQRIKGEVGATRVAVELGWISRQNQVGQTGKTVRPKLYIACGISGAIQHIVGMQNSDFIVAINKNPEAPIFQVADLGIVGDLYQILPAFIENLERILKGEIPVQ